MERPEEEAEDNEVGAGDEEEEEEEDAASGRGNGLEADGRAGGRHVELSKVADVRSGVTQRSSSRNSFWESFFSREKRRTRSRRRRRKRRRRRSKRKRRMRRREQVMDLEAEGGAREGHVQLAEVADVRAPPQHCLRGRECVSV